MNVQDVINGKKVIYHPIIGEPYGENAVITSDVCNICGSLCCKIDIRPGYVDIEALEEV